MVFALLNPGIGYVQGMNQIVAVLYYSFYKDFEKTDYAQLCDIEADTFFCFHHLMAQIRDRFCNVSVDSEIGIVARVNHFWKTFKLIENQLWFKLDKSGIQPYVFGFRWFLVLMAQEMTIEKTSRLWDTLFSDPFRFDFLNYFAICILKDQKPKLMKMDGPQCLLALQDFSQLDLEAIITKTKQLLKTKKKYKNFLLLC